MGQAAEQRALAGIRFADQSNVGDDLQLQYQQPLLAVFTRVLREASGWWPT